MTAPPDFDAMPLPELMAWQAALAAAVAAVEAEPETQAALMADDEAVTVVLSVPVGPAETDDTQTGEVTR